MSVISQLSYHLHTLDNHVSAYQDWKSKHFAGAIYGIVLAFLVTAALVPLLYSLTMSLPLVALTIAAYLLVLWGPRFPIIIVRGILRTCHRFLRLIAFAERFSTGTDQPEKPAFENWHATLLVACCFTVQLILAAFRHFNLF